MHHDFDHENPDIIWIHSDAPDAGCTGSYYSPFSTLEAGLDRVKPGQTIVLMSGEYVGNCTIQTRGTARNPVRIFAEQPGSVVIKNACWFFYDISDVIVSGFIFDNSSSGAVSILGTCNRNRFENLRFINCGTHGETACALYMGGAGGGCTIVENCDFQIVPTENLTDPPKNSVSVGLMMALGDTGSGRPIVNNVVRGNRFCGYDFGIIAGSGDFAADRCGHIIEYNTLKNGRYDGILVKAGDILVRGNMIDTCHNVAINIRSEFDCRIEENRIVDSGTGIRICGNGHSIFNNCIIQSSTASIKVVGTPEPDEFPVVNCFIEHNTVVIGTSGAGSKASETPCGIVIDPKTTGIIRKNLFCGEGRLFSLPDLPVGSNPPEQPAAQFVISDNLATDNCPSGEGTNYAVVNFHDSVLRDYGNSCGFGASGPVLTPQGPVAADNDTVFDNRYLSGQDILEDENGDPIVNGENYADDCPSDDFFPDEPPQPVDDDYYEHTDHYPGIDD